MHACRYWNLYILDYWNRLARDTPAQLAMDTYCQSGGGKGRPETTLPVILFRDYIKFRETNEERWWSAVKPDTARM